MTAVVSLSEVLDLAVVPGSLPHGGRFANVASGLTSRSVAIRHDGSQHGVQISLTPSGARAIYGVPAAALVDTLVPLDELLGRHELGLTPKTVARILRFEHAHQLAVDDDPLSWAQISAVAGYADQAHLVRDWREFTGRSPTEWRRGEVLVGAGS